MLVRDVMSTRVLSAGLDGPVKDVVTLLLEHRIGGVPVLDEGSRVVGIVSESDLQPTGDGDLTRPRRTVADVMTRPVITLMEDDTVIEAARLLLRHGISRAPVVREGVIVGMITRSDLLRPYLRTDPEIRADVEEVLFRDGLGLRPDRLGIDVTGGVVRVAGIVADPRQRAIAVRLARGVEGVIDVVDELRVGPRADAPTGHASPARGSDQLVDMGKG